MKMNRSSVWLLAASCAIVVANNYYNQPLLADFASTFHVTERDAGGASIMTQVGYALGMLVFLPLGDMIERRLLINALLMASAVALAATALAPSMQWMIVASFAVGFTSIVPQVIVPFAAHLAPVEERGRVVGIVMGGLLTGILLSRSISGFVATMFGWPAMYWLACGMMVGLMAILSVLLPKDEPVFHGTYSSLMISLWGLVREQPVLRETALIGALQFAAFSAFWTTLAFHLNGMPAHYGSDVAGLFGLVGLVGVAAAPLAGRLADWKSPRLTIFLSSLVVLAAFVIFAAAGTTLLGVAVGVILLDLGMQSGHVSIITRNYGLKAEAMSRVNTVYMVSRFFGGAVGSAAGNYAWSLYQWAGLCVVGLVLALLTIGLQIMLRAPSAETALP
ncbi:MAG: transporter [Tardiphaga sp.]|jgi:predicted MFS family arabinose efflux permease|nr:transporter [Tardiphaga sp.]